MIKKGNYNHKSQAGKGKKKPKKPPKNHPSERKMSCLSHQAA